MELLKQYQILFQKGSVDLRAAENLFHDFESGDLELDLEVILFHCQQAAEKFLKALLAVHQIHCTKTHNLRDILTLVKNAHIAVPSAIEDLLPLTFFAVEGRYGIIHDDLADTSRYFQILNELKVIVQNSVQPIYHS